MPEIATNSRFTQRRQTFVDGIGSLCRTIAGQTWRVAVFVVGMAILAMGVVLLPLPGPGTLVVALGLGILSIEFAWARQGLARLRGALAEMRQRVRERLSIRRPK